MKGRAIIDRQAKPRRVRGKAIDHELVPNVETIEAMKAAWRGELVTAGKSSKELLASLNRGKADFAAFDRIMGRKGGASPVPEDTLD